MVQKTEFIWLNGRLVKWDEARVHVLAHALHYGTAAFEGIRAYRRPDGSRNVFKLAEHVDRLFYSLSVLRMGGKMKFTKEEIISAVGELLDANGMDECYVRPIVFYDVGVMGIDVKNAPVSVAIAAWPWGAYLGAEGMEKGIRVTVSPYKRPVSDISGAKIGGSYYVSVISKAIALDNGFDEAIMTDSLGNVAEGSGENLFFVKGSVFYTPALGAALPGITRAEAISIIRSLGFELVEGTFGISDVLSSDEAFFTGTAAEITPIREIDGKVIGSGTRGRFTKMVQDEFFRRVRE